MRERFSHRPKSAFRVLAGSGSAVGWVGPPESFTETNDEIAPVRSTLIARAGRWATTAVGRDAQAASLSADKKQIPRDQCR